METGYHRTFQRRWWYLKLSVIYMRSAVPLCYKHGQLRLETFVQIQSAAKESFLLEKYRRFVGCYKHLRCLQRSMPSSVEVQASQLVVKRFSFIGEGQMKWSTICIWLQWNVKGRRNHLISCLHDLLYLFYKTSQYCLMSFLCILAQQYSVFDLPATWRKIARCRCKKRGWKAWMGMGSLQNHLVRWDL